MLTNPIYGFLGFDNARALSIDPDSYGIWHPFFRPWRPGMADHASIIGLKNPTTLYVGQEKNFIKILSYPFFIHKSGRFITAEEFYTDYEPCLCVESETVNGAPVAYLYNLKNYDLFRYKFERKNGFMMKSLDHGRYNELIKWFTQYMPWKTNPNIEIY